MSDVENLLLERPKRFDAQSAHPKEKLNAAGGLREIKRPMAAVGPAASRTAPSLRFGFVWSAPSAGQT